MSYLTGIGGIAPEDTDTIAAGDKATVGVSAGDSTRAWVANTMNSVQFGESLILRYISDHGLGEGARLPSEEELAAILECEPQALESAIELACQRGIIGRDPVVGLIVEAPLAIRDQEALSFSRSAARHGAELVTMLKEASIRLPRTDPDEPFTTELERRAQKVLGLDEDEPFVVITRHRMLHRDRQDVDPRVIHRVFLDPKRFPTSFLSDHNFERESLVDIYNRHGFTIKTRSDALRARTATLSERNDLKISLGQPVLDLDQRSVALGPGGGTPFVIEYLKATYWNITFEFER